MGESLPFDLSEMLDKVHQHLQAEIEYTEEREDKFLEMLRSLPENDSARTFYIRKPPRYVARSEGEEFNG